MGARDSGRIPLYGAGQHASVASIASNISGMATAAALTAQGVTETQQAAIDLARLSAGLHELVARFTY